MSPPCFPNTGISIPNIALYLTIMKLYLNEKPRTFIVTSNQWALIIRHPKPTYKKESHHHLHVQTLDNRAIVEFVNIDKIDFKNLKVQTTNDLLGFLGLLNIKGDIFLMFISESETIGTPRVGEDIKVIKSISSFCLNSDKYDQYAQVGKEVPPNSVKKFLCEGDFYYSNDFDITSNIQERGFEGNFKMFSNNSYYKKFMWNFFLNNELINFRERLTPFEVENFDQSGFLTTITRGYVKTCNIAINKPNDSLLTIINKQSCNKTGPLFGDWGSDDDGNVSNFQECEVIIYNENFCFSYILLKGNLPIFWEVESHFSKNKLLGQNSGKKILLSRSFETCQNSFKKHFDKLFNQYGDLHVIKSFPKDNYKSELNKELDSHLNEFNKNDLINQLNVTDFPLKNTTIKKYGYSASNPYNLINLLSEDIIDFGALFYDSNGKSFVGKQSGVFRIVTFDSLSKANFICKIISQEVIELALRDIGIKLNDEILVKHAKLWEDCNHHINKNVENIITVSNKLKSSSATSTKKTFRSKINKKYLGNVVEVKVNENAMLKLLGRLHDQNYVELINPIHNYINKELSKKSNSYISSKEITLFATTFNINGICYADDIDKWIFPEKTIRDYDLILIGIQEIIELTATKMVNIDSENKKFWTEKIKNTLNRHGDYSTLWTGQLGGLGLFIFVKKSEMNKISEVESAFKKTGFRGVSSNKGCIAVRFNYENTQLCFVTSHLAAGLNNVEERHYDYKVISKGVKFSKNRKIKDHDGVIWLGDLNFRINLNNEQAKLLIQEGKFNKLFEFDQLNKQMANGESFPFFDEMEIKFPPTYKFDNGTKTYDTSEKQRIPAWTDRILNLSRNKIFKQLIYNSYPDLTFSDHRPVYSIFKIKIDIENETIKKNLTNEIYDTYKQKFGEFNDLVNNLNLSYLNDKILPPPSSDSRKWWLDGLPAKISINELNNPNNIINPHYPKNPFKPSSEVEFISKKSI